jgi:hypothetical protein
MKFRTYLNTLTPRIRLTPKYFASLQITKFCTTKNVQNIYNSNHFKHQESSLMPSSNFNNRSTILIEWSWPIFLAFKTIWNSPYPQTSKTNKWNLKPRSQISLANLLNQISKNFIKIRNNKKLLKLRPQNPEIILIFLNKNNFQYNKIIKICTETCFFLIRKVIPKNLQKRKPWKNQTFFRSLKV